MRNILPFLVFTLSSGCATVWMKPGSSTDDLNRDRYSCLQQAQQMVSTMSVDKNSQRALSSPETNPLLFYACMNARGWSLTTEKDAVATRSITRIEFDTQMTKLKQSIIDHCSSKQNAPYYAKTACDPEDITLEQMADKSRILPGQKSALSSVQSFSTRTSDQVNALLTTHDGEKGSQLVAYDLSVFRPKSNKLFLDLFNEKITWGEFNQGQKENHDAYQRERGRIYRNY